MTPWIVACQVSLSLGLPRKNIGVSSHFLLHGLLWWLRWQSMCLECRRREFDSWARDDPLEKEIAIHCSILGEGNGTSLQYSCLENPMDGGAWWAAVHGVAQCQTQLSAFTFTFHFHTLEKEMATHSSVLAWRIPGTGEPGGLPSLGSHRVTHD